MDEKQKLERLKEYMEKEFGVTPQNIDEKLEELRKELRRRIEDNKTVWLRLKQNKGA